MSEHFHAPDIRTAPAPREPLEAIVEPIKPPTPEMGNEVVINPNVNFWTQIDADAHARGRVLPASGRRHAKPNYDGLTIEFGTPGETNFEGTLVVLGNDVVQIPDRKLMRDPVGATTEPIKRVPGLKGLPAPRLKGMPLPFRKDIHGGERIVMPSRKRVYEEYAGAVPEDDALTKVTEPIFDTVVNFKSFKSINRKERKHVADTDMLTLGTLNKYGQLVHLETINQEDMGHIIAGKGGSGRPKHNATRVWWDETHEQPHDRTIKVDPEKTPESIKNQTYNSEAVLRIEQEAALEHGLQGLKFDLFNGTEWEVTGESVVNKPTSGGWKSERQVSLKVHHIDGTVTIEVRSIDSLMKLIDGREERATLNNPRTGLPQNNQHPKKWTAPAENIRFEVANPTPPEAPVPAGDRETQREMITEVMEHAMEDMPVVDADKLAVFLLTSAEHFDEANRVRKVLEFTDPEQAVVENWVGAGYDPARLNPRERAAFDAQLASAREMLSENQRNIENLNKLISEKGLPQVLEVALDLQHDFFDSMQQLGVPIHNGAAWTGWAVTALAEQRYFQDHPSEAQKVQPGYVPGDSFNDDPSRPQAERTKARRQLVDRKVGEEFAKMAIKFDWAPGMPDTGQRKTNDQGQQIIIEKPSAKIDENLLNIAPDLVAKQVKKIVEDSKEVVARGGSLSREQHAKLGRLLRQGIGRNANLPSHYYVNPNMNNPWR